MSTDFFDQLQEFSYRYFDSIEVAERETLWGYDCYVTDQGPKGVILHYTADSDFDRVVKWFMQEKYEANVSAHLVVADRRYPRIEDLLGGLPLVAQLPVTVVLCSPLDKPTKHGQWANGYTIGIEILNAGRLRKKGDFFYTHWRRNHDLDEPEWSEKWCDPSGLKTVGSGFGRYWESYPTDQLRGLIMVLRQLLKVYPGLDPSWILGHENVWATKQDPGPLFPLNHIRASMFSSDVGWLDDYDNDFEECRRNELVRCSVMALAGVKEGSWSKTTAPSLKVLWDRFYSAVQGLQDITVSFGIPGKTALALLGYHIPDYASSTMTDLDKQAVKLFQKCMNLKPDRIPGPKTRRVLLKRLYDQGVIRT